MIIFVKLMSGIWVIAAVQSNLLVKNQNLLGIINLLDTVKLSERVWGLYSTTCAKMFTLTLAFFPYPINLLN